MPLHRMSHAASTGSNTRLHPWAVYYVYVHIMTAIPARSTFHFLVLLGLVKMI